MPAKEGFNLVQFAILEYLDIDKFKGGTLFILYIVDQDLLFRRLSHRLWMVPFLLSFRDYIVLISSSIRIASLKRRLQKDHRYNQADSFPAYHRPPAFWFVRSSARLLSCSLHKAVKRLSDTSLEL